MARVALTDDNGALYGAPADWLNETYPPRAEVQPLVATAVADAVAADSTVAAAAESAVSAEMVRAHLSYTLTETLTGASPDPLAGWTVARGTPTFVSPGKQGTGALRFPGVMHRPTSLTSAQSLTVEFFVRSTDTVEAGGTAIKVLTAFTTGSSAPIWIAKVSDGSIRFNSGNGTTAGGKSAATLGDQGWHHVAAVITDTGAGQRSITGAYYDGTPITMSGTALKAEPVDALVLGGLVGSTTFDSGSGIYVDAVRVSTGARYTGAFTPPSTITADGTTTFFSELDPQSAGSPGYQTRPSVPAGAVTYVGSVEPSDWLTGDRWYQA